MGLQEAITDLLKGNLQASDPVFEVMMGRRPVDADMSAEDYFALAAGRMNGLEAAIRLVADEVEALRDAEP